MAHGGNQKVLGKNVLGPLAGDRGSVRTGEPVFHVSQLPALVGKSEEAEISGCVVSELSCLLRERGRGEAGCMDGDDE